MSRFQQPHWHGPRYVRYHVKYLLMKVTFSRSIDPPPYPLNERGYNPAAYTDARDDESNDLLPQQYFSFDYGPKTFHRVMQMLGFFLLVALVAFYFYWHSSGRTHDKIRLEWENLTSSNQCLRYGTREYSATLSVPVGMDPVKECWQKTIDIHGRQILPSRCDTRVCFFNLRYSTFKVEVFFNQVVQRTVTGHWIVDFKEPACVTWWRGYDDKVLFNIYDSKFLYTNDYSRAASNKEPMFVSILIAINHFQYKQLT